AWSFSGALSIVLGACMLVCTVLLPSNANAASKFSELKVFPPEIHLTAKQDRQSLVVQAMSADGATRDVTDAASFAFADQAVARVEKGWVVPLTDGRTELQVKFDGRVFSVPVTVANAKSERPLSFKLDVMPVFMKAGCNAGACHGASRGKDGFRLSL